MLILVIFQFHHAQIKYRLGIIEIVYDREIGDIGNRMESTLELELVVKEKSYNIFLKNLENPDFKLPYLPNAHLVARLFIRIYKILIVYVQIDIESNYRRRRR